MARRELVWSTPSRLSSKLDRFRGSCGSMLLAVRRR
jgi:hypothetical protein